MTHEGDCIEFSGYKDVKGYGNKRYKGKIWRAHRLAWLKSNGPIPKDLCVCHHCDNPSCVNVEHLFLGTYADNNRDRDLKGRQRNGRSEITHCPKGHKYTEENTYIQPSNNGRICRVCNRLSTAKYAAKKKLEKENE